jgi:uncharacterized membrane protein
MLDYTVIQPNKELRVQARGQLRGVWEQMILAVAILNFDTWPGLIYCLRVKDPMAVWEDLPEPWDVVEMSLSCINIIIIGALCLGFAGYCLKITRGQEISIKNIFDGFKRFLPSFLLMLFSGLFTFLWCLLLIIPGIVKGLGYSMAFFIMYDNPEIKPLEAIKRSSAMTKGYKWKLFKLLLSVVGQAILVLSPFVVIFPAFKFVSMCCLIGISWLTLAYIGLSLANFYENLKKSQEKTLAKDTGAETADISNDRPAVQDSGQEVSLFGVSSGCLPLSMG